MFGLRWGGTGVFLATEARVQLHEWTAILTGVLVQAVLLVFVAILAPGLLPVALIGAMVYSLFLVGQRLLNEAAYVRIDHRLNELYHASPLSPEAYFLGMATGLFVAYAPPFLLLAGLLAVLHPMPAMGWAVLAAALLAVWLISSVIGYYVSTLFRDMKTIWPYSSLLANLLGIVPPVFYPLALVPEAFRPLALVLPTSAAASLATWAAGLTALEPGEALLAAASLALEAMGLFAFGIYWARRSAREA